MSIDPIALALLALAGGLWWRASRRLGRRGYHVPRGQAVAWWSGLLVLAFALMGPLDVLADETLMAHMGQHLLIGDLSAPLIVVGLRTPMGQWFLPRPVLVSLARTRWLRRFISFVRRPLISLGIFVLLLYSWHLAFLFEGALRHPLVHVLQHECFFLGSALVWMAVLEPQRRRMPGQLWKIGYLGAARMASMFLGIALIFSRAPWYEGFYGNRPLEHGLTPLVDQRYAGGMMMTLDIIIVFGALCLFFWRAAADADLEAAAPRAPGVPSS
jgi:putative membrane protein